MEKERIYDYTTLDMFQDCRKKYYWRMVRHLEPKVVAPALSFGKAIHEALHKYYTQGLDAAIASFRETYEDREGELVRTVANGVKLLETYAKVYAKEPFTVIGEPEIGFAVPVGDVMYAGRLDMLVDWQGDMYVLEHKTTTRLTSQYFKQFKPNLQVDGYIYGAQKYLGRKCMGAVINVLEPWKEVKRVGPKTKSPEEHFVRDISSRSDEELQAFELEVGQIVREIKRCEVDNEFTPRKKACFQYNFSCPYKQLCLYGDDPRLLERDYVVNKWIPYKEVEKSELL